VAINHQRGFTLPLFFKIFLAITTVVALALLAAILVTKRQGDIAAKAQIDRDLKQILSAQQAVEENDLNRIEERTSFISNDPNVAQYFGTASSDNLGAPDTSLGAPISDDLGAAPAAASATTELDAAQGQSSILDLLQERVTLLSVDTGVMMDVTGRVLARAPKTQEQFEETLKNDSFVAATLKDPEFSGRSGYWRDQGKLYMAAISPISSDDTLLGYVLLGTEVSESTADKIAKVSAAQIALFSAGEDGPKLIGTSLKDSRPALEKIAAETNGSITQAMSAGNKRFDLTLRNQPYTGELKTIYGEGQKPLGAVLALTPTDLSRSTYNAIQRAVNWTGVCALLAAFLASWFLARTLLKPIRSLANIAGKAAGGDYNLHVETKGNDEIGELSRSFDSLLTSLREKGDMEGFVTSLTKHMPENAATSSVMHMTPARDAKRLNLSLVGIELRHLSGQIVEGAEASTLASIAEFHASARDIAKRYNGLALELSGARMVLGFGGEKKQTHAMYALADLHAFATSAEAAALPAAVIHNGEILYGSLPTLDGNAAVTGIGMTQLCRLLAESSSGVTLLGPAFAKTLLPILGHEPTTAMGAASGKRFYTLTAADLQALPRASAAGETTKIEIYSSTPESARNTKLVSTGAAGVSAGRLTPGTRIGGRFEIQSVLGAGGMGVVYKAQDLKLDDVIALKMLKGAALLDSEHLERLKDELKLARKITHPNILRTHDFGEFNGQPFISMEYVRGMTLRHLIDESERLPYFAALRIARQIASGLQAAHAVGVLHRDIKPENVIIEGSGNAKLMDFGIARPIRRTAPGQTQPGMFIGTPTYSAPEALAGEDVDARSDIYSLGVMYCELFCGKLPFETTNTMELYIAHSQSKPTAPSVMWPEIPKPLEQIILQCLEKAPSARFTSAEALGAALSVLKA
jgi:eukaryotic-like serine/threonine-protein kinase